MTCKECGAPRGDYQGKTLYCSRRCLERVFNRRHPELRRARDARWRAAHPKAKALSSRKRLDHIRSVPELSERRNDQAWLWNQRRRYGAAFDAMRPMLELLRKVRQKTGIDNWGYRG